LGPWRVSWASYRVPNSRRNIHLRKRPAVWSQPTLWRGASVPYYAPRRHVGSVGLTFVAGWKTAAGTAGDKAGFRIGRIKRRRCARRADLLRLRRHLRVGIGRRPHPHLRQRVALQKLQEFHSDHDRPPIAVCSGREMGLNEW
jgi:hypothetical protein